MPEQLKRWVTDKVFDPETFLPLEVGRRYVTGCSTIVKCVAIEEGQYAVCYRSDGCFVDLGICNALTGQSYPPSAFDVVGLAPNT